jgi:outer membrane receptor protein involved in Fe transport
MTANAQEGSGESEYLEEIITTGSRIKQDANLTSASPVTTLNAGEIQNRGIVRVEDLVNDLPQVVPELTANESNGATGTATLDLRGLGSDRTLVLTNGHRMGLGNPFALAPDVNQVPAILIERVELLTGGASSVYGADAVAGVVNFIMKDDFDGFMIDYQYSAFQHDNNNGFAQGALTDAGFDIPSGNVTDGSTRNINVVLGVNKDDGTGNLTAYLGYRDIEAIMQGDRDYSACALSSSNGVNCQGSATIPTGLFSPFDGTYFTVAGDQFVPWDYTYYNYAPLNYFQRPDERFTAGAFGYYEITPGMEGYAEIQFMDDRSLAQIAPSGAFFVTDQIPCENPLLSAQQFSTLGCTSTADVADYYIGRRNVEGGPRFDDLRHTNMRTLVGLRGDINDAWEYDMFANFSRVRYSQVYNNDLSITRITRALDVVDDGFGNPVCRSVVDGSDTNCVPWNLFQTGGVTQEALDYLVLPLFAKADLEQNQIVGYVSGDLGEYGVTLPTAEEGIALVLGYEYRQDSMEFNPDQGFTSGDGAGQGGPIPAVSGKVRVGEWFGETRIPLVQGRTFFESLALNLRYRYSDYDNLGITTDTWNVGGEWRFTESVMLRGGVSRAVRAPNINELFQPQSLGLWAGVDGCAGPTPALSAAACANQGVTAAQYGSIPLSPAGQYNRITGGNPDLEAEESDSVTAGVVVTPGGFAEGLSFSVDYWNIQVDKAVATGIGEENTINLCGSTGDAAFCDLISRGPNGNLWIGQANVLATQVNIGFFEVEGVDINADYAWDFDNGHGLNFALRGTAVTKWDEQPVPGGIVNDCNGFFGEPCGRPRPEWKHTFATTWNTPWNAQFVLGWRNVGEIKEFGGAADAFTAKSQNYLDLSANYLGEWFGTETTINIGISNVTDEDPPIFGRLNNISVYGNGNTVPGTWDAMGRYYYIGLNVHIL